MKTFLPFSLHVGGLHLLPVVIEMFQILLYRVDRLVGVVNPLIMLVWVDVRGKCVGEVSWDVGRCVLAEEAL